MIENRANWGNFTHFPSRETSVQQTDDLGLSMGARGLFLSPHQLGLPFDLVRFGSELGSTLQSAGFGSCAGAWVTVRVAPVGAAFWRDRLRFDL